MKKTLLITTIFLSLAAVASAQEDQIDNRETFQIGAKIGGTYSNVYNAKGDKFEADPKLGLTVGGFVMIPLGKYFGVQPEIGITQKGFKGSGNILGSAYSFKRTSTFLEVPIFFAIKPSEFITILAGPQYSYLIHSKYKFENSAFSGAQEDEFKLDNIRKNILGFALGVDINLKHLVLGGRVGWDLQNNKGDGTSSTPKYKNVSGQLTIGYKIYK
ncbi:MAG TPA: porin family protein [Edaphocola sp.]|nr:porin family protein [Edaphocola sp.]